jgi:hypothetical protein
LELSNAAIVSTRNSINAPKIRINLTVEDVQGESLHHEDVLGADADLQQEDVQEEDLQR